MLTKKAKCPVKEKQCCNNIFVNPTSTLYKYIYATLSSNSKQMVTKNIKVLCLYYKTDARVI